MAGLNLGMGAYGNASGGSMTQASLPAQATSASSGRVTIAKRAFGITTAQNDAGPATAGFGTVALGIAGAAVLFYLWWSLPR